METKELAAILKSRGINETDLDEIVDDLQLAFAAEIINSGMESQLDFIAGDISYRDQALMSFIENRLGTKQVEPVITDHDDGIRSGDTIDVDIAIDIIETVVKDGMRMKAVLNLQMEKDMKHYIADMELPEGLKKPKGTTEDQDVKDLVDQIEDVLAINDLAGLSAMEAKRTENIFRSQQDTMSESIVSVLDILRECLVEIGYPPFKQDAVAIIEKRFSSFENDAVSLEVGVDATCPACHGSISITDTFPEDNKLYTVYKFFKEFGKPTEPYLSGCTLEEAREECSGPDSHGEDWFFGYREE